LNQPVNLYLTVNLATGSDAFSGGGITENTNNVFSGIAVTYGSDWSFDSTLKISVCSDYDGSNSLGCTVQNLKVQYYFYSTLLSVIDFANQGLDSISLLPNSLLVTMLADYQLNEGTGTTLSNSQGTLGPASLCNLFFLSSL